jgi:uncharacterized protein (TIGR02596 family)
MDHVPDELTSSHRRQAFSLIEILTVSAILALLTVLAGPPLAQALRGGRLSSSTDTVTGVLEQARLSSLSRQRPVEVRFFAYIEPDLPGRPGGVHAVQAFVVGDSGNLLPLGPVRTLADRAVITTNPVLTTIWSLTPSSPLTPIPRVGLAYDCRAIRFLPDGGTSLASSGLSSSWSLTLVSVSDDQAGAMKPPRIFATVVIDPLSGTLRTYRPSLK